MNLLSRLFSSPPQLSQVEAIVLDHITSELAEPLANILRTQRDAITKIQRLDQGREVDFYYEEDRKTLPKFEVNKDVCDIAKVIMKSEESGHESHATVQIVKGILFSINFNAPPNDLRNERLKIIISIGAEFREGP